MPAHPPSYTKLVFISYDNSGTDIFKEIRSEIELKSQNIGLWIYQRLKYALLPVESYSVDESGGSNFAERSIDVACSVVAVLSNSPGSFRVRRDLEYAHSKNKEIFIFLIEDEVDVPDYLSGAKIYNSQNSYSAEASFEQIKTILLEREYPASRRTIPNGTMWLQEARQRDYAYDSFHNTFYMRVFDDIYNKSAKIQALRDLGHLKKLSGLIVAVVQDDPQEEVRAEAVLSLAKFNDYELDHYIELIQTNVQKDGVG